MIEDAQRAVPIGNAPAIPAAPAPRGAPPSLQEMRGQPVPDGFFEQPSSRPGEPETAGLDMGAGPGSELLANPPVTPTEANAVLQYVAGIAERFSSQDAADILSAYQAPAAPEPVAAPVPAPPAGALEDEAVDQDVDFEEGLEGDLDLSDDEGDLLEDFDPDEPAPDERDDFDEEGELDDDELAELREIEEAEEAEGETGEEGEAEGESESAPADEGGGE